MLCIVNCWRIHYKVESGVWKSNVDSLSSLDTVPYNEWDIRILLRQSIVEGIIDKVQVCLIIVGDAKRILEGSARVYRQPNMRNSRINESQNATRGEKFFCRSARVGELNGL